MGTTTSRTEGSVAGGAVDRKDEDEEDFKKSVEKSSDEDSSSREALQGVGERGNVSRGGQ